MDKYNRNNRISEALNIRNTNSNQLSEKTGIYRGTISNWIKQKYQPKQKNLLIIAKALNVSEMWLAGYDVPMERPIEQIKSDELALLINKMRKNEELKNLFISISKLNEDQLLIIKNMVNELSKVNPLH